MYDGMNDQKRFFEALKARIGKYQLVDKVVESLKVSEDAAYRRIRGVKELSFSEILKLAKDFSLSLDEVVQVASPYRSYPFYLYHQNFFDLEERDYRMSDDYVNAIQVASKSVYSEFGAATNSLPMHTRASYEPLYRFFILKWMYLFSNRDKVLPYAKIVMPEQLLKIQKKYTQEVQKVKYTYIIYQYHSLLYLINDIIYFREIRLLTPEDVKIIKDNLNHSLDHIETLLIKGVNDYGNRVDIYESGLNFETSYSYLSADNIFISMIDAFSVGAVTSLDDRAGDIMYNWMQSLKRTAVLVSNSEKNRIQFMDKQRKLLLKI